MFYLGQHGGRVEGKGWIKRTKRYAGMSSPATFEIQFTRATFREGGALASRLVRSSRDRAVRARALAKDIVLCSWARHFTLSVPLFIQVQKWVPANLMLGVTMPLTCIPSRGK